MRLALCVSVLASILAVSAFAQQQEATIIVGTVSAERTPIAKTLEFVGRVEAVNRVQINARVKGFLEDVLFKEGELVKKGDPLYRIEQGTFEAAVQQTQGALERSKGAKALTEIQLQRAEQLLKSQSGSAVARDQAKAADEQANGAILSDEASLKTAEINLSYTDIRSPISGRIGRTAITTGNVVGPETGLLTLIVSQDPMYVTFPVSQREFLKAQKENRAVDIRQIKVRLRFSDGSAFDQEGSLESNTKCND
jgi:membrane fusion protein (multidrug efflux system)